MRLFGKLALAKLALKQPPRAGVIMNVNRVSHTGTMVIGTPLIPSMQSLEAASVRPVIEVRA
ncbi:MAG: hypothetical protein B7Y80_04320 [Hyphomicrobium sp. 32-62-53]|nr:MAG: hypothetical protein B7Z29_05950 [Hyphomicrobium sp. 12-62-95]OYY01132.1 MAG: hypothetical protein B7Y80_04320 [Hyphomicrobium sp. 32-62-53]